MSSDRIVAISQPYYFPWLGACEIYSLADTYVFLDDVNFQKQGLNNRIRVKSSEGLKWMTVQLTESSRNKHINMTSTLDFQKTKQNHLSLFRKCYESSPFVEEALEVLRTGLDIDGKMLSDVAINSEKALFGFFEAQREKEIVLSSRLNRRLKGSQGVLEIVQLLKGNVYLTAHGAANYLNHEDFERNGIEVRYMDYGLIEYPQQFGQFTPYISGLDAIANVGHEAKRLLSLETISWRNFLANKEKPSP